MAIPKLKFNLGKIGPREKTWIFLWGIVVLCVVCLRFFLQPRAQAISQMRAQVEGQERQKISLLARQPDIQKRQAQIDELKEAIATRYEELQAAEEKLLDVQDVDELLDSLVRDRKKFELLLTSIRPIERKTPSAAEPTGKAQAEAEPYRSLLVQLDLVGTFKGLVDYIDFLEQMRPYQEVSGLKVRVEGKDGSRPRAVLFVSVLMGETMKEKEAFRKEIFASLEELATLEGKDPFLTGERPKVVVQAVGLELSGILSEGGKPVAAMINNEIYRVGQVIQGKRIVAIEPTRVVLEQGNRRFILMPAQQKEAGQ